MTLFIWLIKYWRCFDERVHAAQKAGLLAAEEVKTLVEFEAMQQEVIKVNEFSFDFSTIIS
jgi:hypothetical protein